MTTRARPRFRVRVGSMPAWTPSGYGWWYETLDTSRPEGRQTVVSGIRPAWRDALDAGLGWA